MENFIFLCIDLSARFEFVSDVFMVSSTCVCIRLQMLSSTTESIWTLSMPSLSDMVVSTTSLGKNSDLQAPNAAMANYSVVILFGLIISATYLALHEIWLPLSINNLYFVHLLLSALTQLSYWIPQCLPPTLDYLFGLYFQ